MGGRPYGSKKPPISPLHAEIGRLFRQVRETAGKALDEVDRTDTPKCFNKAVISCAENGISRTLSPNLREAYRRIASEETQAKLQVLLDEFDQQERPQRKKRKRPAQSSPVRYTTMDLDVLYRLTGRSATEVIVSKAIRAEVDELSSVQVWFKHPAPEAVRIEGLAACRVVEMDRRANGDALAALKLPRTLSRSDEHSFRYRVDIDPSAPLIPWGTTIAAKDERYDGSVLLGVQFDRNELPERVWWSIEDNYWDLPSDPAPGNELPVEDGYVEKWFTCEEWRCNYTINWRWP